MADAALDNLGRKIDTTNMSIGELKGLIASLMKNKVGPSKPVGGSKDDPAKKLTTLFEKYVKDFEKETKEQKKLLERIADGIKEMKSQKAKEKKQDKNSFSEKANKSLNKGLKSSKEDQAIAKSTKSLADIFGKKGSGYTHDIYCEKFLKAIYGVLVDIAKEKGIVKAPAEDIAKEAKKETKRRSKKTAGGGGAASSASSYALDSRDEWIRDAMVDRQIESMEYTFDVNTFADAYKWTSAIINNKQKELEVEEQIKKYSLSQLVTMGIRNKEGKIMGWEELKNEKIRIKNEGHIGRMMDENSKKLKQDLDTIQDAIFGFKVYERVFKGVLKEEREFTQKIREAAYEVAGVTGESQKLQKSFEDIGLTAKLTGFDRSDYQKAYINNLKSGIKDQKKAMALTTTQLNTEKQVGIEAGGLGDSFIKLNNELKFTNDQTAAVGRGIREVGRNTGLVGKDLAAVVSSSQQFVDQMRKAGTATASSVTNVIGLQAEFKKLGITDTANKLLTAISSTTGFYEAGAETQSLIASAASRVGLTMDMTTGAIVKSDEKLKTLNKGFIQLANNLGLSGSNAEEMRKTFDNLPEEVQRTLNLRFKAASGMEVGDFIGTIEAVGNKTKTLTEKLADLNKEKAKNLTLEERTKVAEEERKLRFASATKVLDSLSESAKDVTSMDQALAKFSKRRGDFEGDIKALGGAWSSETDAARTAIQSSVNALNEGLKKAGKKGLSIDSRKIEKALKDPAALRELTAEINKGEQELATAQKAQADPITSMDQTLKEINDGVRKMSQGFISGLMDSPIGKALIGLTAVLGFLASGFLSLRAGFFNVTKFMHTIQQLTNSVRNNETFKKLIDDVKSRLGMKKEKSLEEKAQSAQLEATRTASDTVKSTESIAAKTEEASKKASESTDSVLAVLKEIRDCICKQTTTIKEGAEAGVPPGVGKPASEQLIADSAKEAAQASTSAVEKAAETAKKESRKPKKTPAEIAALKAAGQARKDEEKARGVSPAVARSIRKNEIKNVKMDTTLNKMQKKEITQGIKNNMKTSRMLKLEEQSIKANPEAEGFDLNKLISSGKEMGKAALAVTILGLGAVALGSAIVFVAKGILKAFNLDMKTIIEVAGAVAALAAAGGAIVGAGFVAYEALKKDKKVQEGEKVEKELNTELLKQVAFAALLGPTLVLLGATIVKVAQLIVSSFGLDMSTVAEVAGAVVAIVGAAGALLAGVATALDGLEELKKNETFNKLWTGQGAKDMAKDLGKAAVTLIGLTAALVLLASAVVWIAKGISGIFGLDMGTAAKIAGDVGAIIAAAGFIALACVGALKGLEILGKFVENIGPEAEEFIWEGAAALLLLAPAVTFLAAIVTTFCRGILGLFGIDAGVAAKVAWDVGVLITAAGAIAFAIIGALAGLALLGLLDKVAAPAAPFVLAGAAALFILAPAVIALAAALMFFVKGTMWILGMDGEKAVEIAKQVGSLLGSAAAITLSILASMAGLAILGAAIPILGVATIFMLLGTVALLALTPAVIGLAAAVIYMAAGVLKRTIDPKEAKEIVEALNGVLGAASDIAWSILMMVPKLAMLGSSVGLMLLAIPFMYVGAWVIRRLAGPVEYFINVIKDFYESISFVNPKQAVKMGEESAAIFKSVGEITGHILKARGGLLSLVGANQWGWFGTASEGMKQGAEAVKALMEPVEKFIESIKDFYGRVSTTLDPEEASKMGSGIADILCAVGRVVNGILQVKKGLINLKGAAGSGGWFGWMTGTDFVKQMGEGKGALEKLQEPVEKFITSIKDFYGRVSTTLDPEKASKMGNGIADILCAVGRVVNGILLVKRNLINLRGVGGGGWFGWITGTNFVSQMYEGSASLKKLEKPVEKFIESIRDFYNNIALIISPEQAKEAGNGVGLILGAVGFVTNKLILAKDALIALSKSGGFWGIDYIVTQMNDGSKALEEIMWPVIDYALKIQFFSNILQGLFGTPEEIAKSANGVANILRAVGFTTWYILASAKMLASINSKKLAAAFANSFKIINEGMIAPIRKNLASTAELEEALHQLDLVLEIAEKMQDISEICKGLSPVNLGSPIEGKLGGGGAAGGTTSDKAISQRNEAKQAGTLEDSTRILSEFVETSLRGKGIIVRTSRATTVSAVPAGAGGEAASIQTRIQRERAASSPKKSEISSSELSDIADNTEKQNIILGKMEKLLQKFVELAKPNPEVASSGGGPAETPLNNGVVGKPTNYYRRVIGNVNNTPSRAIVNVGAKAIS